MGAELLYAYRQTDLMKLIVTYHNFASLPKKCMIQEMQNPIKFCFKGTLAKTKICMKKTTMCNMIRYD